MHSASPPSTPPLRQAAELHASVGPVERPAKLQCDWQHVVARHYAKAGAELIIEHHEPREAVDEGFEGVILSLLATTPTTGTMTILKKASPTTRTLCHALTPT